MVEALIAALKDPESDVRGLAAPALGHLAGPRAVEPLISALKDRDSTVRMRAAYWLGPIKDRNAVKPLVEALIKSGNSNISEAAAKSLVEIGDPGTIELLLAAPGWESNYSALSVIFKINRPRALEILLTDLKNSDPIVRSRGARGLSAVYDASVVPALIAALDDPDGDVCRLAAIALGTIGDDRAVQPLTNALKRSHLRTDAAKALVKTRDLAGLNAVAAFVAESGPSGIAEVYGALIMSGNPAFENGLVESLNKAGDRSMAEAFINSGNPKLERAAAEWARAHGYEIRPKLGGSATPRWGSRY